jgi:hypothetical protein
MIHEIMDDRLGELSVPLTGIRNSVDRFGD